MVPDVASVRSIEWSKITPLFGVSIYSFMCHHSLPSLVTPMRSKKRLNTALTFDFALILSFYLLLCYTAVFRFPSQL